LLHSGVDHVSQEDICEGLKIAALRATLHQHDDDMEDLVLLVLAGAAELFAEVLFELLGEELTALAVRLIRKVVGKSVAILPILAILGYFLLGAAYGALSVGFYPHPLIRRTKFHGASLVISPVITGLIMARIGLVRKRNDKDVVRVESFQYGFSLALGAAAVRFLFAK